MIRPLVYDFLYPLRAIPVIEVNLSSTAQGRITLNTDKIEEISTLTSVIYLATPPDSSSDNWQGSGSDVSSPIVIDLSSIKLESGLMAFDYVFDPSAISPTATDGQFYAVTIKVNAADDATSPQAGIELIFKINDRIEAP